MQRLCIERLGGRPSFTVLVDVFIASAFLGRIQSARVVRVPSGRDTYRLSEDVQGTNTILEPLWTDSRTRSMLDDQRRSDLGSTRALSALLFDDTSIWLWRSGHLVGLVGIRERDTENDISERHGNIKSQAFEIGLWLSLRGFRLRDQPA